MEQSKKLKVNMSIYRRLNIQHKINDKFLKQNYDMNIKFYKFREEKFHRKYEQNSSQIINHIEENSYQLFLNQQIFYEHEKQLKINKQKEILLKKFDELKHTINDPNSTLSVLTALSRSLLCLDSQMK